MNAPSAEPQGSDEPAGLRSLLSRDFIRVGMHTYAFAFLTLGANFASGVVTARALAPAGRGQAVAISMLAQNLGFLFAVGCIHAVSYRYAREPGTAGRLATTWTLLLIPLSLAALGVGELALPALFGSQTHHAIVLARIYLPMVALVLWTELTLGLLLGARDYRFVNAIRFAQPALFAAAQIVMWRLDALTVASSLGTAAASTLLVQLVALARVIRNTGGFGRPDLKLGLETLWYGFRGHGAFLANALNQRLDLLIMPAFVAAAALGLYTVAANVSLIVSTLAYSLATVVLPAAAHDPERAPRKVLGSLQAAVGLAAVLAVALVALARPAIEVVYGSSFGGAAPALRVLLPGTVLLAGASILVAGLYAANRPTIATGVQLGGLAVTVVGLLVFLPGHGIIVAAIVSTASYAVVFVGALVAYKRVAGLGWRAFLTAPVALRPGRSVA
jgi:O-antigen/teichoic acid export membrane protein